MTDPRVTVEKYNHRDRLCHVALRVGRHVLRTDDLTVAQGQNIGRHVAATLGVKYEGVKDD
jgi:hypothetical protein